MSTWSRVGQRKLCLTVNEYRGGNYMVDRLLGKKVIGIKQATKSLKNGLGKTLYIASDADEQLVKPVIELAKIMSVDTVYIDTMKALGKLCGIDVGSAVTLILKE